MRFPDSPRILYRNNPLAGVTCQLNFPPILQIDKEVPAEFQERIRRQYPVLNETRGIPLPPEVASIINSQIAFGNATYEFRDDTADRAIWRVSLARDALSLSTSKYVRWEEFRDRLALPFQAFVDLYTPAFFTRIGLRYQNVIRRGLLKLDDTPWRELLNSEIAGILATVEDETDVEQNVHQIVLRLDEDRKVLFQHGFGFEQDKPEQAYLIDNDFFTDTRTEVANVGQTLYLLNEASGKLFRWCISDRLHTALEPVPVE